MKPIKITMSAFGSYGGREEIDFSRVNRGIFLITGDTGAGKTTVFDAITYALFDETSGGRRDGDMMRSQFADEGTPTFVELLFDYGGQQYIVRRNPNYRRISKRRNKEGAYTYTMESAAVELTMPDGTVFPGKNKETNEKIREILGMDVSQFTQISMIAQGEFLKLLHAPSRERKEIFSRIFDTRIYWQIQNRLKETGKALYGKLAENRNLLEHVLFNVQCPAEELKEAWKQAAEKVETGQAAVFALLEEMERSVAEQAGRLEAREKSVTDKLDDVKVKLARAKEQNLQFTRKQETEASVSEIQTKLRDLGKKQEEWEGHRLRLETALEERLPVLTQELAEAKSLLPKYERLKERQEEQKGAEVSRTQVQRQLEQAREQEGALKKQLETVAESQKGLEPELAQLPALCQQEKEGARRLEEQKELKVQQERMEKQKTALKKARARAAEALERLKERNRFYEQCSQIYVEEQAGLLAEGLEEGSPCPVCGSKSHPRPARLSGEAVTQKQVAEAKEQREEAQQLLDEAQEAFRMQKEQWEGEQRLFLYNSRRLLNPEGMGLAVKGQAEEPEDPGRGSGENPELWVETWGKQLDSALEESRSFLKGIRQQKARLEAMQEQYRKQAAWQEEQAGRAAELVKRREALQERAYETDLAYEKAAQSLKELQEQLSFPSKEYVEEHMFRLREEKRQLEGKQKTVQETLDRLRQQLAKGEGVLEEQRKQLELLKTSLEGKEAVDISGLQEQERELAAQKGEMEKGKLALFSLKNGNLQQKEQLERLYEEREALVREYETAETLSRTANGNLRQQARLDLQTYVQRRYFKQIVGEANRRLAPMSGGRFLLRCRELDALGRQQEAGLDLDVYDMVTDRVRDVKTLSGGESFLAALSMALGMADVVQKTAGKVRLDTMFIDEGFGSLDEESRGKAIGILQGLAGETRLVGIISHVTELKEQMDRKLVVCKGEKGSRVKWQMESFE